VGARETRTRLNNFERNPQLEELIRELNTLLEPAEWQAVERGREPDLPVVFIVGSARAGTTLLLQALGYCCGFAYPTNLLSRFYRAPYLGARIQQLLTDPAYNYRDELGGTDLQPSFESDVGKTKGILASNVFWYFIRRFFPDGETAEFSPQRWAATDREGFVAELAALTRVFQKPFVLKGMCFNWNLPDLVALFDKAVVLDIERDPLANVDSILSARQRYYGDKTVWWSYRPPEMREPSGLSPAAEVASQVFYNRQAVERGLALIPENRKLRIRYEALCSEPEVHLQRICDLANRLGADTTPGPNTPKSFPMRQTLAMSESERDDVLATWARLSGTAGRSA